MKLSEVNEYKCHDVIDYERNLKELKTHPKLLEIVESFINSIKTEDIDSVIQELYSSNKLNTIYSAITNIYNLVYYGDRICRYIESYKGWYRLTKDVEATFYFEYYKETWTETYKKGSYIKNLTQERDNGDRAYFTIPEDAVEKVPDFEPPFYYGEDGNEYYADWGKYIEGVGWEFENNPIETEYRVY